MAVRTAQELSPGLCRLVFSPIHRLAFGVQSRGETGLRTGVGYHRREKRSPICSLTTPGRHLSMMPVLLPAAGRRDLGVGRV
jgi:hypothetical protein